MTFLNHYHSPKSTGDLRDESHTGGTRNLPAPFPSFLALELEPAYIKKRPEQLSHLFSVLMDKEMGAALLEHMATSP